MTAPQGGPPDDPDVVGDRAVEAGEAVPGGPAMAGDREATTGGRRMMAYAVLLAVAGAGLALYAATRVWSVEVLTRPQLPPSRITHTGGALQPWLPALALVGLAGAGAVLATRGLVRRLVGGVLTLVGLGVAAGGAYGLVGRAGVGPVWPALCLLGGLAAVAGNALTAARGQDWPAMGARYERPRGAGTQPAPGGRVEGQRTREAWDALDRGEDPTVS